ncbi:uncharacterized protein LOC143859191 isoform X2 [Tasmannia lanceolata]|uniref:uncharacterized protein LOC143859191 isoform X2 n=1 Tax=Tasmannia lanceolata TaxID=3420 RepID=UPI004064A32E
MSDLRLQYCHVSGNDLTFMVDSLNWLNCRPPPLRDKGLNVRLVDGPGDIGKHVSFLRPKKVGIGRWREAFVAGWIVCFLTGRRIERSLPVSHNKCLRSENEANIAKWQCELMLKMDEASKSIEESISLLKTCNESFKSCAIKFLLDSIVSTFAVAATVVIFMLLPL